MSEETFHKGEKVEWKYGNSIIEGEVIKKLTHDTDIKSHHVSASKEHPEYLVRSDKTGKEAAHKASALTRIDDDDN